MKTCARRSWDVPLSTVTRPRQDSNRMALGMRFLLRALSHESSFIANAMHSSCKVIGSTAKQIQVKALQAKEALVLLGCRPIRSRVDSSAVSKLEPCTILLVVVCSAFL